MNNPILTIIIPVYNLENYIRQCFDSIYSQGADETQFEVIAVDDGSADNSLGLMQHYAENHVNLRVIHQTNGGVSRARNHGIVESKAQFITFVDGDDVIISGSLPKVLDILTLDDRYDVLYCHALRETKEGVLKDTNAWFGKFNTNDIFLGSDLLKKRCLHSGVWGGCYRKSFLEENELWFAEDVANGEDTIWNLFLCAYNPKIHFTDVDLNQVVYREGSASHSNSMTRVERFVHNVHYLQDARNNRKMTKMLSQSIDMAMYHTIMFATNMYISIGGKDWREMYTLLEMDKLWKLHVGWAPFHQKLKIMLINISYKQYFIILKNNKS